MSPSAASAHPRTQWMSRHLDAGPAREVKVESSRKRAGASFKKEMERTKGPALQEVATPGEGQAREGEVDSRRTLPATPVEGQAGEVDVESSRTLAATPVEGQAREVDVESSRTLARQEVLNWMMMMMRRSAILIPP